MTPRRLCHSGLSADWRSNRSIVRDRVFVLGKSQNRQNHKNSSPARRTVKKGFEKQIRSLTQTICLHEKGGSGPKSPSVEGRLPPISFGWGIISRSKQSKKQASDLTFSLKSICAWCPLFRARDKGETTLVRLWAARRLKAFSVMFGP